MKKKYKKIIYIILAIIILLLLSVCLTNKFMENDIFYSIKIGEVIKNYGIDFKDHFAWISNLTYTYPHWLFDYIIYRIYNFASFDGIYHFAIIMFFLIVFSIFILNLKKRKKINTSLITAILVTIFLSYFSSSRAQIITYLVFLLEIYFIDNYLEKKKISSLIGLFILPIIIANTHIALFYFYFILFIPYITEYIIAIIVDKMKITNIISNNIEIKKEKNLTSLLKFLPFIFLTGFISPLGLNVYTYYPKVVQGVSTRYIMEHDPITIKMFSSFFFFLLFYFISIAILKIKIKLRDILLLLGLVLLTFLHNRNYALFLILCNFIFCDILEQLFFKFKKRKYPIIITIIVIVLSINYSISTFKNNKNVEYVSSLLYPKQAITYIKENLLVEDVKLFNEYDYGSYLILNDIPVFVDSRAELYTKEFNPQLDRFFTKSMRIESYYQELFTEYEITHVLVHRRSILNIIIEHSKDYNAIYEDNYFLIYQRLR